MRIICLYFSDDIETQIKTTVLPRQINQPEILTPILSTPTSVPVRCTRRRRIVRQPFITRDAIIKERIRTLSTKY